MKYLYALLSLFAFHACTSKDEIAFLEAPTTKKPVYTHTVVHDTLIGIPINQTLLQSYSHLESSSDGRFIFGRATFPELNQIHIYDLHKGKPHQVVAWDAVKYAKIGGAFSWIEKDSTLLLYNVGGRSFLKINFTGEDATSIPMNKLYSKGKSGKEVKGMFIPVFSNSSPVCLPDNSLIIPQQMPPASYVEGNLFDVVRMSADGKQILTQYLRPDSLSYAQLVHSVYPLDLSQVFVLEQNGRVYISYPMDHYVYVYETYSGKFLFKKTNPMHKAVVNLPQPIPIGDERDHDKTFKYRMVVPYYRALQYHKEFDMFSRLLVHPIGEDDVKSTAKNMKRKVSVFIFDKNLDLLGEEIIDQTNMGFMFTNLPDGWVSIPNINDELMKDENMLYFSVFKIMRK